MVILSAAVGSIEVTTVLVVSLLLIVESTVLDERLSALIGEAGMVELVIEIGRHSWIEAQPVVHGTHIIVRSAGGGDDRLVSIGHEIGGARVALGV